MQCHFSIDSETIIIIIGTLKSETASKSPQMQRGNDFERSEFTVALYSCTITHTHTHTYSADGLQKLCRKNLSHNHKMTRRKRKFQRQIYALEKAFAPLHSLVELQTSLLVVQWALLSKGYPIGRGLGGIRGVKGYFSRVLAEAISTLNCDGGGGAIAWI